MDFRAFVPGGFGDLAIPGAGGGQRALAEGEVGVGDLELGVLGGAESTRCLARPDGEFLDQVFGFVVAACIDVALEQPERVFDRKRTQHGSELVGVGEIELPRGVIVS